jgi:hypothetical protein
MFHIAAYSSSIGAGPANLAPLVDQPLPQATGGPGYQLPSPAKLLAATAFGGLCSGAQLVSPTLRQVQIPSIRPVVASATTEDLQLVQHLNRYSFTVPALEPVIVQATNSAAGPTVTWALVWFQFAVEPMPQGQILIASATSTGTATAGVWTTIPITFSQQLPTGTYGIVSSEHISATGLAHRFVFTDKVWRPGSLSHQAVTDRQDPYLLDGALGCYGTFQNTSPPNMDVLCTGADATHQFYIGLVPISVPGIMSLATSGGIYGGGA